MSCCGTNPGYAEIDEVSRLVSAKLAAFLKTLRDNGFAVGLHEGRDAAALMAAGYVEKPTLLRIAFKHLFSARKSDWEKFDGLFDAFWLGRRVKSRSMTVGSTKAANSPSLKSLQDDKSEHTGSEAATDQIPSADDAPEDRAGEGRMEGASRADNLAAIWRGAVATGSTCAVPSTAISAMAACRSASSSDSARTSRCVSSYCSMLPAR